MKERGDRMKGESQSKGRREGGERAWTGCEGKRIDKKQKLGRTRGRTSITAPTRREADPTQRNPHTDNRFGRSYNTQASLNPDDNDG